MMEYCGEMFPAKLSTNMFMKKKDGGYVDTYEEYSKDYYSALYGLVCNSQGNHYCANISGFNLKPRGYFVPDSHNFADLNKDAVLILKSSDASQLGVDYFFFHLYNPFETTDFEAMLQENHFSGNGQTHYRNQLFAQVRLVMKYRNQLDNGSASNILSRSVPASSLHKTSIIYVSLEEVE